MSASKDRRKLNGPDGPVAILLGVAAVLLGLAALVGATGYALSANRSEVG
jgi:hypothetical protein